MKIGIDARIDAHGVGTYIRELIRSLSAIDKKNEYVIFVQAERHAEKYGVSSDNFKSIVISAPIFSVSEQICLPYHIKKEKIDLFHATSYVMPLICPCPSVVTIHDLLCKANPSFYPPFRGINYYISRSYYSFMNWYAARFARHIMTVSEFAKGEILHFFPSIPPEKITVTYNGVGRQFGHIDVRTIETVRSKYCIDGRYILFVGTFNPRKNLVSLMRAFAGLTQLRRQNYKLVIAARKDLRYPAPLNLANELNLGKDVVFLDYVPEELLPALYSGAEVLVFPSFHESFGLPVVEAFACGVPVITSNQTALPEVAGEAALLVNPAKIEELREAILKVMSDSSLRDTLIRSGYLRSRQFSWMASAHKVLNIYESVYS